MSLETKVGRFMYDLRDVLSSEILSTVISESSNTESSFELSDSQLRVLQSLISKSVRSCFDKSTDALIKEIK